MIRLIDIRLNAAHPELPLCEATTYTGAPSTVLIRGVPPNCGRWAITAVFVAVSFPDGSTTTRAAVQSANGVWVATLPATATSGRTTDGFRVIADGVDENGEAVTGYILGVADFAVASLNVTPAPEPGGIAYTLRYFDTLPDPAKKGDVTKIDGVLKYYDGTAWQPFAALDDAVTSTSANGVKSSGIWAAIWGALTALPAGFTSLYDWVVDQLAGKLSTSGGTVTGDIHMVNGLLDAGDVQTRSMFDFLQPGQSVKSLDAPENSGKALTDADLQDSSSALGAAFAAKADDADVVHKTGNETVGGVKTFDSEGIVVQDSQTGFSMKLLDTGIAVTDGSSTAYFYVPGIVGGGGTFALLSDVMLKADRAPSPTAGNLAALSANGDPVDSDIPAANVALKSAIPYDLGTPIVIDTASSETVEGETVYYGAATLANRTANIVQVTAATALDELRITFPAETSGKVRDFGLRVEIGTGSAALAAPALVPIAPTGETIKIENNAAEFPALADGTATAKGVTLLYFSENAPGVFVVKGEQVEEVA